MNEFLANLSYILIWKKFICLLKKKNSKKRKKQPRTICACIVKNYRSLLSCIFTLLSNSSGWADCLLLNSPFSSNFWINSCMKNALLRQNVCHEGEILMRNGNEELFREFIAMEIKPRFCLSLGFELKIRLKVIHFNDNLCN